ncbi:MAG: hypothetical protein WCJ35_21305 [Planctomycetota bacterium]
MSENRSWAYSTGGDVWLQWRWERAGNTDLNPLRVKLANHAAEWPWSSARAHLSGRDDRLVKAAPLGSMIDDWEGFLNRALREEELRKLALRQVRGAGVSPAWFNHNILGRRRDFASKSPQLLVRVFLRKLRLPVLCSMKNVQDANCFIVNTVHDYMTMPALSLADLDITQPRARFNESSPRMVFT